MCRHSSPSSSLVFAESSVTTVAKLLGVRTTNCEQPFSVLYMTNPVRDDNIANGLNEFYEKSEAKLMHGTEQIG